MSMDLDSYRYLLAVHKYRSISAAARKLYITQPALTKHINRLEKEFGVRLFQRNVMPIQITPAGECFIRHAEKILDAQQEMLAEINKIVLHESTDVTIGCTLRGGEYFAEMLRLFMRQAPEINLSVEDSQASDCEKKLLAGDCDIAFYTTPVGSEKIEYVEFQNELLVLVTSPHSHIFKKSMYVRCGDVRLWEIDAEDIKNETYLMSNPSRSMHLSQKALLDECNVTPLKLLYFDSIDVATAMAYAGLGIVLSPLHTAMRITGQMEHPKFCTFRDKIFHRSIVMAKRKNEPLSPQAQQIWDFVLKTGKIDKIPEASS